MGKKQPVTDHEEKLEVEQELVSITDSNDDDVERLRALAAETSSVPVISQSRKNTQNTKGAAVGAGDSNDVWSEF